MYDFFKWVKATERKCNAPLPEVYSYTGDLMKREVVGLYEMVSVLGNPYLLIEVEPYHDKADYDRVWVRIFVDPSIHGDPDALIICGWNRVTSHFTIEEQVAFYHSQTESFQNRARQLNCPKHRDLYQDYADTYWVGTRKSLEEYRQKAATKKEG